MVSSFEYVNSNYDIHRECTKSSVMKDCGPEAAEVAEEIVLISGGDIVSYYCSNHTIFSETCQRLVPNEIAAVTSSAPASRMLLFPFHSNNPRTSRKSVSSKLILAVIASSTIQLLILEHVDVTSRSIVPITINLVLIDLLAVWWSQYTPSFHGNFLRDKLWI